MNKEYYVLHYGAPFAFKTKQFDSMILVKKFVEDHYFLDLQYVFLEKVTKDASINPKILSPEKISDVQLRARFQSKGIISKDELRTKEAAGYEYSSMVDSILEGCSVQQVLSESSQFPEKIFIVVYPNTKQGYVYTKDYEHENGGCYYRSKENNSPVDGSFISLYPDGHLTYTWDGIEKPYDHEWYTVN